MGVGATHSHFLSLLPSQPHSPRLTPKGSWVGVLLVITILQFMSSNFIVTFHFPEFCSIS